MHPSTFYRWLKDGEEAKSGVKRAYSEGAQQDAAAEFAALREVWFEGEAEPRVKDYAVKCRMRQIIGSFVPQRIRDRLAIFKNN